MSGDLSSVMQYRFTGDVSGATAAIQELKARLGDINRDSLKFARETAKGNQESRQSLLESVRASDQLKGKIRELTGEVQKFQQAGGAGGKGLFFMPSLQQLQGALTGAAFGLDDFIQQYGATGRLSDALRGAGNNLTMLASLFGPIPVVATAAGVAVATFWAKQSEKSDESIKKAQEYKKALEELKALEDRGTGMGEDAAKRHQFKETLVAAEAKEKEAEAAVRQKEQEFAGAGASGKRRGSLIDARNAFQDARREAEVARGGLAQFDKEQEDKQAAKAFAPAKDDLKRLFIDARTRGLSTDAAQEEVMSKAGKFAKGAGQQRGLKSFIGGIAAEEESNRGGLQIAAGLEDPNVGRKRALEQTIQQGEAAIHQKEAAAEAERVGMNRRQISRDSKNEIAGDKDALQVQKDQLTALNTLIEEQKRQKDEKYRAMPPKGLGEAGR